MGMTRTNLETIWHAQDDGSGGALVFGWSVRIHHHNKNWNAQSGDVSSSTFLACADAAKVSETAAASALASTWPGWWSGLDAEQRADAAQIWHVQVTSAGWP
jgi:hypothetical protein